MVRIKKSDYHGSVAEPRAPLPRDVEELLLSGLTAPDSSGTDFPPMP